MNIAGTHTNSLLNRLQEVRLSRGTVFGIIILTALVAFESFNFSTTDYALRDVLGDLQFLGLRWSTILTLAFCGIDFAGIARLFTPEQGGNEHTSTWYLFGAWLLAATMNALLTWWGVSIAISTRAVTTTSVVDVNTLTTIVPIFVALMVWLIRILIIGSLSYAGDRIFSQDSQHHTAAARQSALRHQMARPAATQPSAAPVHAAPKPVSLPEANFPRPEPTYQRLSAQPPRPATPVRGEPGINRPSNQPPR